MGIQAIRRETTQLLSRVSEHVERDTSTPLRRIHPAFFIEAYCHLRDEDGTWQPFHLWPSQLAPLQTLYARKQVAWLKARQLGMTWLALAFALWQMVEARPGSTVLLFSRRDMEAMELLDRLAGMWQRLPDWLRPEAVSGNAHELTLANGSRALAFPTTAGDSYTASLVVIDEADLVPDLDRVLRAAKPTIDANGKILLLSRADKSRPESPFKRLYRDSGNGGVWATNFLPWDARPDRNERWYADKVSDSLTRTGTLDEVYEQYPATPEQALASRQLDKRIPLAWVEAVSHVSLPTWVEGLIRTWSQPARDHVYTVGADPAEGNPNSDESAACVLDATTGEQVAVLAGQIEPSVFAAAVVHLAERYNRAWVAVERNNHGAAVLLWIAENAPKTRLITSHGDARPGWLNNARGKTLLYTNTTDAIRDGQVVIRDDKTKQQLIDLEASTLRAPEGFADDRADAFALAVESRSRAGTRSVKGGFF